MSKRELLEKLDDPAYRSEFISSEIDMGIPMQLRAMREAHGWKQSYVAEQTGTQQPRFSLMEKAGYGKYSLNTLKKLAVLFDVGLIVSFVPWDEMISFVEALSRRRLAIASFKEARKRLEARYSARESSPDTGEQLTFVFGTTASSPQEQTVHTTGAHYEPVEEPEEWKQIPAETVEAAHLAWINRIGSGDYVSTNAG